MTPLSMTARVALGAMTIGSAVVVLVGAALVWWGLTGYEDWDASRRATTFALGLLVAIGMSGLLVLLWRQEVAGRPIVVASDSGLTIGSTFIPWSEIDGVVGGSLFGLPHVGVVLMRPALERLPWRQRWQATMPAGDNRMIFISERQIRGTVPLRGEQIWEAWSRDRRPER